MTVSRNRRARRAAFLAAAMCVLASGAGLAQPNRPVALKPAPISPKPPIVEPAAPEPAPAAEINKPTPAKSGAAGIEVGTVSAIDPETVGLMTAAEGGFGTDLWVGSRRGSIEILLPRLPAGTASHAVFGLKRRLLLSASQVPEGPSAGASLLGVRVRRLAATGDPKTLALLDAAATSLVDQSLATIKIEQQFLAGDTENACARVRVHVRQYRSPYWQKALITCQALGGQFGAVALGLELLAEGDAGVAPGFRGVLTAMAEKQDRLKATVIDPSPLLIALLRAARMVPDGLELGGAEPGVLRAIAALEHLPADMRVVAAERSEAMGIATAEALRAVYEAIAFTAEQKGNALNAAGEMSPPLGRALLYQAAKAEPVPSARAEILRRVWRDGRASGMFATAARTYLDLALTLAPAGELAWLAADMGRALLAAGQGETALAWFALANEQAAGAPEAARAAAALWPLLRLHAPSEAVPWEPARLAAWHDLGDDGDPAARRARAALLLSLFEALGEDIGDEAWEPLLEGPLAASVRMPSPALWRGLFAASRGLRVGETVLMALLVLGDEGPAAAAPQVLNAVVSSLRLIGLEADARAIALEAALAAGL